MEGPADVQGLRRQPAAERRLQLHSDETEPHHRDHPVAECGRRASRVFLRQDLDYYLRQVRGPAIHKAGEHSDSDLRCRLLGDRFQR